MTGAAPGEGGNVAGPDAGEDPESLGPDSKFSGPDVSP